MLLRTMCSGLAVLESARAATRSLAAVRLPKFTRHSFKPCSESPAVYDTSPVVLLRISPAGSLSVIRDIAAGGSSRSNSVLAANFRPLQLHSPTSRPCRRSATMPVAPSGVSPHRAGTGAAFDSGSDQASWETFRFICPSASRLRNESGRRACHSTRATFNSPSMSVAE